jgi:hypothetical protein
MKKACMIIAVVCGLVFVIGNTSWAYDSHRFGGGVRYWITLEDVDTDEVDENGFAYILSYQYQMAGFFKLEGNVEFLGEGYAGSDDYVISPQVYFLVGRGLYGGLGVGINLSGGDFDDNAYFALRAGVDFEILPSIFLDINGNYRFEDWNSDDVKEDINTDTVTLGAIVRFEF